MANVKNEAKQNTQINASKQLKIGQKSLLKLLDYIKEILIFTINTTYIKMEDYDEQGI